MPVKLRCTGCQKVLTAPDAARGKAIKCPHCESRVVVPGGDAAARKKKAAAAATPDSESAIASLDLRSLEDKEARICPKCGYDMSHYDEETTECPKCGYDATAGGLGEKARKRQLKGPDPDKFYAGLWKSNWQFVLKHQVLAWRTILYTLIASLLALGCAFMYLWISPVPPRAFFGLCTAIAGMMVPGWMWFLDQELVKASLERKEKLKRINLDIFLCSALGVKFVVWHAVFAAPLLAIPALIGWVMVRFGGMPSFVLPVVVGVCYLPVFSMLPIVIGHMIMPNQGPGWMFWKVVPAWLQTIKPCLIWLLLVIATCAPAIACVATIGALYGNQLQVIATQMDHNAAIARAKTEDERKGSKDKTKGQSPLLKEEPAKVDFMPLIVPGVLWVVACLTVGFPAVYLMRVNGQLVYYFRDYLGLQALAKEYKYVAKARPEDEEDAKPKTLTQVLVESLVMVVICMVIGLVGGLVYGSMSSFGVLNGLVSGLIWGTIFGAVMGRLAILGAAFKEGVGWGLLVLFVSPLGDIIYVVKNWEEGRVGCLTQVIATVILTIEIIVATVLALSNVIRMDAIPGQMATEPDFDAPQDPGVVPADGAMPAQPGAPQIPGQNLPGAEVLDANPAAAFWWPRDRSTSPLAPREESQIVQRSTTVITLHAA